MTKNQLLWTIIVGSLALFAIAGCKQARADWAIPAMNKQVDETNFVVNRGCSGTLVGPGQILTAAHCVNDQYETIEREEIQDDGEIKKVKRRILKPGVVSQLTFSGTTQVSTETYRTKLLKVDKNRDLALLQIRTEISTRTPAKIACKAPVRGDTAYLVGNPRGVLYSTLHKGLVSSVQRDEGLLGTTDPDQVDMGLMQISAGATNGNSGGAAYNDSGEIIGVLVSGYPNLETLSFTVPVADIREFLKGNVETNCGEE
jgi:S1-C subfamily serine protease